MSTVHVVLIKKSGLTITFSDSSVGNTMLRIRESMKENGYEVEHYEESPIEKMFISIDGDLNEYTTQDIERSAKLLVP